MVVRLHGIALTIAALVLGGCATPPAKLSRAPPQVHAQLLQLLPARAADREAWAAAITDAFFALQIDPTTSHLCATLAVVEQESGFVVDPRVPALGKIAREEIEHRAAAHHIPGFMVAAALALSSDNGKSYSERIAAVHTERELSLIYEDLVDRVPLGRRLLADSNPVRTGGPMQVSIEFAEQQARARPYPYPLPANGTIRHEVFTLRGGVYFGVAHLLGFPVTYDRMIYRFADFNAGLYASRNAAFQNAVAVATGRALALDGDLVDYGGDAGATELAVRSLAHALDLSDSQIRAALELGTSIRFEQTPLYTRVFALAERKQRKALPRAMVPRIDLSSPKITRKLTTRWFAERVDRRYRSCLARAAGDAKTQ
jgi:hypothetical protein